METPEFTALLEERMQASTTTGRAEVDARILDRYQRTAAAMVIDMSGFSRITKEEGIVHFLELIHRMHRIVLPLIHEAPGGHVVKTEADNVYALFDTAQAAVHSAVAMQNACAAAFEGASPNNAVRLSIGIAWGQLLDLDGREFFGDPVNLASKLGEDLANAGELFVTAETARGVDLPDGWRAEPRSERISNIQIDFVALARV